MCKFEIGDFGFGLGSDTPCHAYGKGGGSLRAFRRARFEAEGKIEKNE